MVEYASKAVAGTGLGTGIAGLALGVMNALGSAANVVGNGRAVCAEETPVSRGEMRPMQENAQLRAENAQKDAYIYTDQQIDEKLGRVVERAETRYEALAAEVRANKDAQNAINMTQAVYNGTNTATIACLQGQVAALQGLTKLVVPNSSVCPGWGDVTVTPQATTQTTGA